MKSIEELFLGSTGKVIYKWHHYLPIYESLFNKYVGKKIKVLEIGVLRGGSLRLWSEYFGPDAEIHGVDIDPGVKQYEGGQIKIHIGDQSDQTFLRKLSEEVGGFDIVIDDGAHTNFMVMNSIEALYPTTKHLYVVEDTHALYWWGGGYSLVRDIQCALSGKENVAAVLRHLGRIFYRLLTGNLSFMSFVKRKQDSLTTDWHGRWGRINSTTMNEKMLTSAMPTFTATTTGVRVYDSVVVFEKENQQSRIAEVR